VCREPKKVENHCTNDCHRGGGAMLAVKNDLPSTLCYTSCIDIEQVFMSISLPGDKTVLLFWVYLSLSTDISGCVSRTI